MSEDMVAKAGNPRPEPEPDEICSCENPMGETICGNCFMWHRFNPMNNNPQPPKQPREWDIDWNSQGGISAYGPMPSKSEGGTVRVIEKSAYEALERELAEMKTMNKNQRVYFDQNVELKKKITQLQAQLCREQKQSREGAKEMGDKISALKAQLEEANKERELVVNNFHGQVGLNRKAHRRIKELEWALEKYGEHKDECHTGSIYGCDCGFKEALKGCAE